MATLRMKSFQAGLPTKDELQSWLDHTSGQAEQTVVFAELALCRAGTVETRRRPRRATRLAEWLRGRGISASLEE